MMNQPDEAGFVKRGFALLGLMLIIVCGVLAILFYRPGQVPVATVADLPAHPSAPGWQIRYNATATLARRGDDNVPWKIMEEMLDEGQQMRNFVVTLPDGRDIPDEAAARSVVITALKALGEWHRVQAAAHRTPSPEALSGVYAKVDRLAQSPILELKVQAEKARQSSRL